MILTKNCSHKAINDLIELNKEKIISITFEAGELVEIITDDKILLDKFKLKGFA
tara:strand:+ start:601 stop:762 length:162 start_codon:yes stop_codon:yes gene_type:complete